MWHSDQTMRLLLRWSYSTRSKPASALRLKALAGELGCEQGKPGCLEATLICRQRKHNLKESQLLGLCSSCSWEEVWSLSFSPFFFNIYVSKSDLFVPLTVRGSPIAYASAGLFVCSYRQAEVWDPFSQKRSIMGKKDIFHINSILKVVRDRSGLWCSRKNSQLKSMKGWDSKLIARFHP